MKFLSVLAFVPALVWANHSYKFHYGQKVVVHSSAWAKPCYDDDFVNVCGRIGTVIRVMLGDYCDNLYVVRFEFHGVESVDKKLCEPHLKDAGKK